MQSERLLHVCLRTPVEGQPALAAMLRSLAGQYEEFDWQQICGPHARAQVLLATARQLRPTVVFMQLQNAEAFSPATIEQLRAASDPSAVIVSWDGDQPDYAFTDPRHAWFIELGKVCDASLVTSTAQPPIYAAAGVKNPGYLQIGIDEELYQPRPPTPGTPEIVFLASRYEHTSHARRTELAAELHARYGNRFAVYGHGWESFSYGRALLTQPQEAGVYSAARCAISMSMRNDLPAYSSDRLFRALASGAVTLVEYFPELETTVGLQPGLHGFEWAARPELFDHIDAILDVPDPTYEFMRRAASEFARRYHSWKARAPELREVIRQVRASR